MCSAASYERITEFRYTSLWSTTIKLINETTVFIHGTIGCRTVIPERRDSKPYNDPRSAWRQFLDYRAGRKNPKRSQQSCLVEETQIGLQGGKDS